MQKEMKEKVNVKLAALNSYLQINQCNNAEKVLGNQKWVSWGTNNDYPSYLRKLYREVPTLQSIVNSTVDYLGGDEVSNASPNFRVTVNSKGELFEDFFRKIALDYVIFGGFTCQVIRSQSGNVLELYHIPLQWVRVNETADVVYVCKEFEADKKWKRMKVLEYPIFNPNDTEIATSVFYYKGNIAQGVYPIPQWEAATLSCEMEREITLYHHNALNNNFNASAIINFNNGIPDAEQMDEVEKMVNEKWSGFENTGRLMLSWNQTKDNQTTVTKLDSPDFDKRYEALAKRTREQIFAAFRCNPNLAGIATENLGFNSEEFNESFKLFNKTFVQPMQKVLKRAIGTMINGEVTITPFSIDFESNKAINPNV